MKNIIVVGDSFCSTASEWPQYLADLLDKNLLCHTKGAGQSWWDARNWITYVHPDHMQATDVIVFAHTNAERMPTDDCELGIIDHSAKPTNEKERAVSLYYKYIFHVPFMHWAQQAWFKEITEVYGHKQLVHLHCFPWSNKYSHSLSGLNITTNLSAISLNELGAKEMTLYNDHRANHLNNYNNRELARQLADLISTGATGDHALDTTKFEQVTLDWFTRPDWN